MVGALAVALVAAELHLRPGLGLQRVPTLQASRMVVFVAWERNCSLGVAYRAIPAGLPVLVLARMNSEL